MNWAEISIQTATEGIEIVCGFLMAHGVSSVMIEDAADFENFLQDTTIHWDYVDEDLMKLTTAPTVIKFYLPDNPQGYETLNAVKRDLPHLQEGQEIDLGSLEISLTYKEEEDWETAWQKYYHPIVVSPRLAVVPEWEKYDAPAGQTVLRMNPGMAFGSGSHDTTRLCLQFLDGLSLSGLSVLDMGCGSGILSIAALLMGAKSVSAVDIDQLAVKIAHENAALNGCDDGRLSICCGNVLEDAALADEIGAESYDIIVANIVADVIKAMAPLFARYLKADGTLVVSGIITERAEEVTSCLEVHGFAVSELREGNGWAAAVLKRA
ncbi:MAG TPA: 50S ribosomal protein L11 methyltransferase [Candidatus Merdivicinus intestinavium]|nr:50S ribosomal protein L11 methyltransferase [Candidatus Merdivicinus intestinavium]